MNEKTIRRIILTATLALLTPATVFAQVVQAPSQAAGSSRSSNQRAVSTGRSETRRLMGLLESAQPGSSGSVIVVPAGQMNLDELTAATEDMTVMTRIFQTALGQSGRTTGMAFIYGAPFGTPGAQSIYLQGYGALFMTKVDLPLSPGPEATEAPDKSAASDIDPVWQQTRQEIFAPETAGLGTKRDEEAVQYSKEKVEELKTNVIKALKHAANIRNLKPEESVVVTITGRGVANVETIRTLPETGQVVVVQGGETRVFTGLSSDELLTQMSVPTVLTIRAKRADIEAFAKGDLDLESFRNKVQIVSHPCLSGSPGRTVLPFISTGVRSR